jgi:GntR family galactonate operon transcriptional repressor
MAKHDSMWMPFAQELIVRIVSGHYPPDTMIPTETQLGAEFGVSRTVIREGTRVLSDKGLLISRRGLGTRVLPATAWRTFDPDILAARLEHGDREVVLREVLVLRRSIEPELAARAAVLCDESDLASLSELMDVMKDACADPQRYRELDAQFHARVAELGRNSLLRDVTRFLEHPVSIQRDLTNRLPGASTKITHKQHDAIFRGILARDEQAARAAMLEHIQSAEQRLDRALTRETSAPPSSGPRSSGPRSSARD